MNIFDQLCLYVNSHILEPSYEFADHNFSDKICLFADNIESGSSVNTNNAGSGSNALPINSGLDPSNSASKAEVLSDVYNKIKAQFDNNNACAHRFFNIYSSHHPVSAQLSPHEKAILHEHLLSLDKKYDFRHTPHKEFRMFVNTYTKEALKPTKGLLLDIDTVICTSTNDIEVTNTPIS